MNWTSDGKKTAASRKTPKFLSLANEWWVYLLRGRCLGNVPA